MDVMSTGSTDSPSRPRTTTTRKTPLRKVFERVSSFATIWTRNTTPHGRRIFHRDVEQEEFHYASTHCLSSYYSVFVARLAIMVMLAILIGLLTILTWHFTKVYTTKSLNTLAYGLRYELLQRPILRMWNILNSTSEITTSHVKLSEYVIRRYSNPSNQAEQVELYETMKAVTWALFASHKALNAMTINYKNGFVQAFHRDKRSNKTFYIYSDLANYSISANGPYASSMISTHQGWDDRSVHGNLSAIWYREPLDPTTGEKIGKAMPILPDDLINIAGLSQVPDGAASWHVAVSKYTPSPLLSAALPVWDDSHENILAVVGVTTALSSVGELMRELVEVHSGHIYLTSQEGYLLATSTNAPLLINSTTGPKLMMAADSHDPVIQAGARWLQKVYGNKMPENHIVHEENARLGHELYYIDSFFLNLKRLPMVGVIIIPRKYIMGKVDERAFKTLVILISASICILVIGCVCIMILTNGVSKEMKLRAELISHLDARRRAEASSNYKSQFLANMSHELRTPMAAVIGLLDILICDDCLTNEQYAMVTQIRKCSTALLRLLNNILDLSKVESGKLVLEEAEFDLEHELEGLVDMFSVQCINHNVETVLDLSDDIPKLVRGDSARVVQIFANLISNSIKFTSSGHIILRGWCDKSSTFTNVAEFLVEQKREPANIPKLKQHGNYTKKTRKKDNKIILWFEIEDTGCGIDPSKWESVFESFEQADPSTTRLHGGTGLGLCIVRTLINKMGGEIKIVRKDGPGTLMRLFLVLNTPADGTAQHTEVDYSEHRVVVLLALQGRMARLIMAKWLRKAGVFTFEASEWNELTHILQELNQGCNLVRNNVFDVPKSPNGIVNEDVQKVQDKRDPAFIFVIDIGLLNLRTDIWKEQLNFLDRFQEKAKFAWMLNHDTSNAIKAELRSRGHILMVNKPLYKAKMVQILKANMKSNELQKKNSDCSMNTTKEGDSHEFLEIDAAHYDNTSSDDSDKFEIGTFNNSMIASNDRKAIPKSCSLKQRTINNCLVELTPIHLQERDSRIDGSYLIKHNRNSIEDAEHKSACAENFVCDGRREQANSPTGREVNGAKSLEGLRILLAEDNPLLQKVATTMLEKLGATVIAVGDGKQAVDALNYSHSSEEYTRKSLWQNEVPRPQTETSSPYDLILMDCQMPKMDGYEATKAIRSSEVGTGSHIPIVALTAHAMSSDEAKCLQVGMDAYLTKPIDFKLMVSTILSLTTRTT